MHIRNKKPAPHMRTQHEHETTYCTTRARQLHAAELHERESALHISSCTCARGVVI